MQLAFIITFPLTSMEELQLPLPGSNTVNILVMSDMSPIYLSGKNIQPRLHLKHENIQSAIMKSKCNTADVMFQKIKIALKREKTLITQHIIN